MSVDVDRRAVASCLCPSLLPYDRFFLVVDDQENVGLVMRSTTNRLSDEKGKGKPPKRQRHRREPTVTVSTFEGELSD